MSLGLEALSLDAQFYQIFKHRTERDSNVQRTRQLPILQVIGWAQMGLLDVEYREEWRKK